MIRFFLYFCALGLCLSAVTKKKDRVVDHKLSEKEPGSPDYDHEAFVGSEEAGEFNDLSPDESKRRLGLIIDKIDKDSNGKITEEELEKWLIFVQTRYIREESEKQFQYHDTDQDGKIRWEEYKEVSYGFLNEDGVPDQSDGEVDYPKLIKKDEEKWKAADLDGDSSLSKEEFSAFVHPEEYDHMKNVYAKEVLSNMDKNDDGYVDEDEYIADIYTRSHDHGDEDDPEWVSDEREQFRSDKDHNKDGKLDVKEVRSWILPDEVNHAKAEAIHLIDISDEDKDDVLSRQEILNNYDHFVGSQVTDWGEALTRHDEF